MHIRTTSTQTEFRKNINLMGCSAVGYFSPTPQGISTSAILQTVTAKVLRHINIKFQVFS
ncbi:hypothetical protein NC651_023890 [Populus alba x Populus x berolinensis]|nr:hypothetical protein NC651_023890 [Populus alba x Populus x berolinensis]